jgi:hypothetical protein
MAGQYGDNNSRLAAVESYLVNALQALGCKEVDHVHVPRGADSYREHNRRRRKILRLAIRELNKLSDYDDSDDDKEFSLADSTESGFTPAQRAAYDAMCKGLRLKE